MTYQFSRKPGVNDYLRSTLFLVLSLLIIGVALFLTWRFWDWFNSSDWRRVGDHLESIEGGNLWYLVGMVTAAGIGVYLCMRQVHFLPALWRTPAGLRLSGVALGVVGVLVILFIVYGATTHRLGRWGGGTDPRVDIAMLSGCVLMAFGFSIHLFRKAAKPKTRQKQ